MRKEKIIMPTAIDVANHILAYAKEQQQPIGNLKLQYVLFLLWKDYWSKTKTDLIGSFVNGEVFLSQIISSKAKWMRLRKQISIIC